MTDKQKNNSKEIKNRIDVSGKNKNRKLRDRIIESYSHFISKFPYIMILIVIAISVIAGYYSSTVKNKAMDYQDMLPDNIEVIKAYHQFSDDFGGSDSVMFVIEVDPKDPSSTEFRDVRDPEIIRLASILEEYASTSSEITEVMSATKTLKSLNNGALPNEKNEIIGFIEDNSVLDSYFSKDGTMMIINLRLKDDFDDNKVVSDLEDVLSAVNIPAGVKVSIGGSSISSVYVNKTLGSDMSKTSAISMLGIILILIITMGSIKYGLLPLSTIIIGVLWAFGFIGFLGLGMSSATSGVISMIMGIGIDFGIQIVTRFKQELDETLGKRKETCAAIKENDDEKTKNFDIDVETSMKQAIGAVIMPMFTTTLAAVLGFKAMTMGELSILGEMGDMMTYGVVFCFLTAVTFVPAFAIIIERISHRMHKSVKKFHSEIKKKRSKR